MFQPSLIKEAFQGLVGLTQTDQPGYPNIAPALLYTGSNVEINHPLITIENLTMTAKNYATFTWPAWSALTTYAKYAKVTSAGAVYESLINGNLNNNPAASPNQWQAVDAFNLYLERVFDSAAEELVNDVMTAKKARREAKALLQQTRFYEGYGNLNDLILNENKLVGVMIELKRSQNLVCIIEQIGLQVTAANPNFKMWVYNSSQPDPIVSLELNHDNAGGFKWHTPDPLVTLYHLSRVYDAGSAFFVMYDQRGIVGQAIRRDMNFHLAPCGGCSGYNYDAYARLTRFLYVRACSVAFEDRSGIAAIGQPDTLWDLKKTKFETNTNWGLNFDFTVQCDLSDFIIKQKKRFAFALREKVTVKLLEHIVYATRINVIDEQARLMANTALVSIAQGGQGLRDSATEQMKAVDFEVSALDSVCMPCNNAAGITIGAHGLSYGR
jgi:hypothetical protein